MRRALACVVAATMALAPFAPARAARALAYEAQARASVLFANVDVQPEFDPAFADSSSEGSTLGTSSLDSDVWPSFLVDAFFFLYGFQSVERAGLGIAQARFPQGPVTKDATLSNLAFSNAGDPKTVPATAGRSVANAAAAGSSGESALTKVALPVGTIAIASSSSSVATTGRAHAEARQSIADVVIGPVRIASIDGAAAADAGAADTSSESLRVAQATVAGTPVTIDGEGVHAQTASAQDTVNGALANAGMLVRIVPGARATNADGSATASSGGVLISVARTIEDPRGGSRDVRLALLLGSATVYARAHSVGGVLTFRPPPPGPVVLGQVFHRPSRTFTVTPPASPGYVRHRIIVTGIASGLGASARGAYLALILLAFGLLLVRPLIRAATRP